MRKLKDWYREQKKYLRWWREHRKEILARTRAHTYKGMGFYFLAVAGLIVVAVMRPPLGLTAIGFIGLSIVLFGSLVWIAKRDSKVIKALKKESNYE